MLPRHIKICRAGTFILELFLASTTLLTAALIWLFLSRKSHAASGKNAGKLPAFFDMRRNQ